MRGERGPQGPSGSGGGNLVVQTAEVKFMTRATREQIQEYLEGRGFAVYDSEDTETLRKAALLDIEEEK